MKSRSLFGKNVKLPENMTEIAGVLGTGVGCGVEICRCSFRVVVVDHCQRHLLGVGRKHGEELKHNVGEWRTLVEGKRVRKSRITMVDGHGSGYGSAYVPVLSSTNGGRSASPFFRSHVSAVRR